METMELVTVNELSTAAANAAHSAQYLKYAEEDFEKAKAKLDEWKKKDTEYKIELFAVVLKWQKQNGR